ncbi:MAG: hypothetical protein ACKOAU_14380 [Pirellula sp.]
MFDQEKILAEFREQLGSRSSELLLEEYLARYMPVLRSANRLDKPLRIGTRLPSTNHRSMRSVSSLRSNG